MDVEQQYDEFGNYIGPDQSDSESSGSLKLPDAPHQTNQGTVDRGADKLVATSQPNIANGQNGAEIEDLTTAVVLAEDKQLYPTATQVFGPDTEVLVEEEDAQPLSEPLVAPIVESASAHFETLDSIPASHYSRAYLATAIAPYPTLVRNVAILGHIHHGKTSFIDMIFDTTHNMPWSHLDDRHFPIRYTDTRFDEQRLKISIKATAAAFLLQTALEKSYAVTFLDTPGHSNFIDEVVAALSICDSAIIAVDVAEGVTLYTEALLRRAASMGKRVVLLLTKLDRLCVELRLPPNDAYHKIRNIIDSCNEVLSIYAHPVLHPSTGNIAFSSATERVCFTLPQFARAYIRANDGGKKFPLSPAQLSKRLWGDIYFDTRTRKFTNQNHTGDQKRTFVSFVLEPYYKLHTAVLSEDIDDLTKFLQRNSLLSDSGGKSYNTHGNGSVRRKHLNADLKKMLKEVNSRCFGMGDLSGFTEMLVDRLESAADGPSNTLNALKKPDWPDGHLLSNLQLEWLRAMDSCDSNVSAPMSAFVSKLVPDELGTRFDCLLRVLSGRIQVGSTVCVLGNSYDELTNREDVASAVVGAIYIPCARFKIEVKEAVAGQIVLVRGIEKTISKSATVVTPSLVTKGDALALKKICDFLPPAVVKVSVEPVRPSELPKMVSSLRRCVSSYPGLVTKVEETGEHTLIGNGEMYMDCVLRDLREAFDKVEVKVSDPVVPFAETVSETSFLQCHADTPNSQNRIVMVAEPLEETILHALEDGKLDSGGNLRGRLREYGWDALAAKSLWTFGPDPGVGPNALTNDVLIEDSRLKADLLRDSIVQGFCWAVREGPLADEPVRGVKIRLLDANVAENETARSPAQVIPTARRVVFSSMLTASPRLMEPIYSVEIVGTSEAMTVAEQLASRRRGLVVSQSDVVGTPLRRKVLHMPVLDSFGFEPDLRSLSHGAAFCVQTFDHWASMPGDPLDKSVQLRPLEAARRHELARECMVKTRRRKGLGDDVSLAKYLEDPLLAEIAGDHGGLRNLT